MLLSVIVPVPTGKRGLVPGLDIFWAIDDVLKYINIYGNAPPANISKKPMTLRVDMTREDPINHLLLESGGGSTTDSIAAFTRVYAELLKGNWTPVNIPSTGMRVERALLPHWRQEVAEESIDLNVLARLNKGKDYFVSQQSVVKYLQVRRRSMVA